MNQFPVCWPNGRRSGVRTSAEKLDLKQFWQCQTASALGKWMAKFLCQINFLIAFETAKPKKKLSTNSDLQSLTHFAFFFGAIPFGVIRSYGNDRLNLNLHNELLEPVSGWWCNLTVHSAWQPVFVFGFMFILSFFRDYQIKMLFNFIQFQILFLICELINAAHMPSAERKKNVRACPWFHFIFCFFSSLHLYLN